MTRNDKKIWKPACFKTGIIGGFFLSLLGGLFWLTQSSGRIGNYFLNQTANAGLKVQEVQIDGTALGQDFLQHLIGLPILGIDPTSIKKEAEALPWIKQAQVERHFPNKLQLGITEYQPAARWEHQGITSLIDKEGRVLGDKNLQSFNHLPLLMGRDAPIHTEALLSLLKDMPAISDHLQSASRVGNRRWDLKMNNDTTVKLPENPADITLEKRNILQELLGQSFGNIDLRLQDRMTVQPKPSQGRP